ncbi:pseudouridine synthase [Bifidobacterium sp. DSM 109958]|uniref:tRNA pseudouridine synthase B n=1 Tax=Bifidobacterium moraviense TaxID=2675323 RepID=A0A7Y0F1N8_9BIFI|nr:pseudouridine synthase [Bifidobacterium sp. DSM 109958]
MPDTSGLIIIDKPQGVTSFDVVAAVRGALHLKKVGHAGTLDPMATGVLIVGFGRATRLLSPIVGHDKTYETTIRLGRRTTTDDADGDLLPETADAAETIAGRLGTLTRETIERTVAEHLTGEIMQVPSTYSAIKIDGQRAYDLAREGRDVELAARPVTIGEFTVLDVRRGETEIPSAGGDRETGVRVPVIDVDARVSCSSGTYIRSLGRDLGELLGVGGHLIRLRRTRVGRFDLADPALAGHVVTAHAEARTFTNREGETITRNRAVLDLPEGLAGAQRALALIDRALPAAAAARLSMPSIDVTADEAAELRYGRRIERRVQGPTAAVAQDDLVAIVDRANGHQAKPVTVFPAG